MRLLPVYHVVLVERRIFGESTTAFLVNIHTVQIIYFFLTTDFDISRDIIIMGKGFERKGLVLTSTEQT